MPRVNTVNESTNPENFYLENSYPVWEAGTYNTGDRVEGSNGRYYESLIDDNTNDPISLNGWKSIKLYATPAKEIGWIDNAVRSVAQKSFDGIMIYSLMPNRMNIYWRRDMDENPILVSTMQLYGRVYHNSAWTENAFNFDVTSDAVDLTVISQGQQYWIIWEVVAFGGITNYMGLEWTFLKGTIDQKFFLFAPEKEVEIKFQVDVRNLSLKENRADERGLDVPIGATTIETETPSVGWTRHEYIFTRTGACETADGRTPVQLFTQDAGLSVR